MQTLLPAREYHSQSANNEYFSVSAYKDFAGTMGRRGCEAMAMAKMRGEWVEEPTTAMLVGSYVDAYFEGSLDEFKDAHPEIFKKDGSLKAEYCQAEELIARCERDKYFMKYLTGEKQKIFTGELYGMKWKCKADVIDRGIFIADLKVVKSIRETHWTKDYGHMPFVQYWGYDIQAAVYQKLISQTIGKELPFYIAAVSKEKYPDLEIIGFNSKDMEDALSMVAMNIDRIKLVRSGELQPDRCGTCDYCRSTKVLTKPIHQSQLLQDI